MQWIFTSLPSMILISMVMFFYRDDSKWSLDLYYYLFSIFILHILLPFCDFRSFCLFPLFLLWMAIFHHMIKYQKISLYPHYKMQSRQGYYLGNEKFGYLLTSICKRISFSLSCSKWKTCHCMSAWYPKKDVWRIEI